MAFTTEQVGSVLLGTSATFSAGVEQSYAVPEDAMSITFVAVGADIDMTLSTGSSIKYTIPAGTREAMSGRCYCGRTLYFTGTAGTLRILVVRGTNS